MARITPPWDKGWLAWGNKQLVQRQDLIVGLPPSEKLAEKGFRETQTLILSADAALGRWAWDGRLWGIGLIWGIGLAWIMALTWGLPAWATTWVPTTPPSAEQQFIDPSSLQTLPEGTVRVQSLYVDQRRQPAQRTTYQTEYRCQTREFRDVVYNGQPGDLVWHSVESDPLNAQTLDHVCAQVGQASTANSSPERLTPRS